MCPGCVRVLVDKKDGRSWDEQKLDWSLKSTPDMIYQYWSYNEDKANIGNIIVKSEVKPDSVKNCICGHAICKNYSVYNDKRKICCIMGSVCICRYKKNDDNQRGAFTGNPIMEAQMVELHRFHCEICDKTMNIETVMKHNNSPTHKKNYKIKHFRACRLCKQYTIERIKPSYYHTCSECYKFTKRTKLQ